MTCVAEYLPEKWLLSLLELTAQLNDRLFPPPSHKPTTLLQRGGECAPDLRWPISPVLSLQQGYSVFRQVGGGGRHSFQQPAPGFLLQRKWPLLRKMPWSVVWGRKARFWKPRFRRRQPTEPRRRNARDLGTEG